MKTVEQAISAMLVNGTVPCESPEYALSWRIHLEDFARANKN